jgi:hypothetical protein
MYDPPAGMPARVERLLQVLAVLRASELPVRRATLVGKVDDYRQDHQLAQAMTAAPTREKAVEALHKKVNLDLKQLRDLGFAITDTVGEGLESAFVLRPTPWRLPVELEDVDETLLAWLLGTVSPSAEGVQAVADLPPRPDAALLGSLPTSLDLVYAALAGRRRLLVEHHGEQRVVEPVVMSVHGGRWYLLARYPSNPEPRGFRLDRLVVLGLDEVMPTVPEPVDAVQVLDATAWRVHEPVGIRIRCEAQDAATVAARFPRAAVHHEAGDAVLAFSSTNLEAVLDRVVGLAGAARLVSPASVVETLRARLVAVLQATA